ncbi:hypothetical protein [Pseudalkalibacillus salsuginis]|uniref:hypothetical protein n=1 Tax=Pseudalkalibacillus salsuginis TaxID=2910972 RepID=UPI001F3F4065|nr:hypothetical protein [Pseudalkalibacillus salsuginis]MCF6410272.1 hypothetical protein [Pseudalkalibacillus salsuginis]
MAKQKRFENGKVIHVQSGTLEQSKNYIDKLDKKFKRNTKIINDTMKKIDKFRNNQIQ